MSLSSLKSKVRQLENQARRAQREFERQARRMEYELKNPVIEIRCSCGHRSRTRRNVQSLPTRCPSCGGPILYG